MTHDELGDNLTKLLVALLSLVPWAVGLRMELKRRQEKKKRERRHNSHYHNEGHHKTETTHADGEHGKSRSRNSIGRGVGSGDS